MTPKTPLDYDKYTSWVEKQPTEFICQVWDEGFAEALHPGCGFDISVFGVKKIVRTKRRR